MSLKIFLAVSREPDLKSVNNLFAVEIRSGIRCTALKRIEKIVLGLFVKETEFVQLRLEIRNS
jgi:hypothetical protein